MEAWRRELYRRKRGYATSELYHYGVSKRDGAKVGSGRYPLGSGENPRSEKNFFDQIAKREKSKIAVKTAAGVIVGTAATAAVGIGLSPGLAMVFSPYIIGASMSAVGAVSGIGEKAIQSIKHMKLKAAYEQAKTPEGEKFPKKTEKSTPEEDEKAVNPFYSTDKPEYTQNCAQCTLAYDMRRRGYDVSAIATRKGMTTIEIGAMYKNGDKAVESAEKSCLKNLQYIQNEKLRRAQIGNWFDDNFKKDGRYNLCVSGIGWGHSIVLEVENGKPIIRDTQSGHNMTVENFVNSNYAMHLNYLMAIRVDNLQLDMNACSTMVEAGWKKKGA